MRIVVLHFFLFFFLYFDAFAQNIELSTLNIEKCLEIAEEKEKNGDNKEATRFLNQAASLEWEKRSYANAIRYFEKSILLNEAIGNETGIIAIENNLGMIYADLADYEQSLIHFEKTLAGRRKNKERVGIIAGLINSSVVLNNLKKFPKSLTYLQEALDLARQVNDIEQMKSCYGMLAETHEKSGNVEKALYYFEFYKTFHEQLNRDKIRGYKSETEKARLEIQAVEDQKRIQALELALKDTEISTQKDKLKVSDAKIQNLVDNLSKQELAIRYLESEKNIQAKNAKIKALEIKEIETKAQYKYERQTIIQNALVAGFLILLIVSFILFRQYENKRKINIELAEKNQKITLQKNLISEQKYQLENYNATLEYKIEERTQELSNANVELIQYNNQLEQFAFVVAHNLRAPIARITGLFSLIDLDDLTNKDNLILLQSVLKCARDLDTIISDLNSILEIKKNIKDAFETVDLQRSIEKICSVLEDQIQMHEAEIIVDFQQVSHLNTVKVYLESIFYNLISNAIKYKAENRNPVIHIKSWQDKDGVCLSFSDNGLGIDLEKYGHKLFNLYKRFHDHVAGKGMGLYLVKTQIEAMQGKIEVKSKLDEGTTFYLYFKNQDVLKPQELVENKS